MSEHYVGEIRLFSGNYAPEGWALCNGQLLNITENAMLYSLIGTTYGGDGVTNFAIPNLCGRIGISQGKLETKGKEYLLGQIGGEETVTLTETMLPNHTHRVSASNTTGTQNDPTNAFWAVGNQQYSTEASTDQMNANLIASVGGNLTSY